MFSKYILPAIAAVSGAYAQCSAASATTTLSSAADATAISGCSTYTGSIALATSITGDITLNGIQTVTGSLLGPTIGNMTSLTSTTMTSIGGNLTLANGANLNYLSFPLMTSVGALSLSVLGPQYQATGFTNLSSVPSLTIQNTYLQSLAGITVANTASNVIISQNVLLTNVTLSPKQVSGALSVTDNNGVNLNMPYLLTAGVITVTNVASLAMPALQNATGAVYLESSYYTTLSLPNITQSAGMTIYNNSAMTNFTLPAYAITSASIDVHANPALTGTISLPALTTVDGTGNFTGAFTGLSIPVLNTIQGSLYINSTGYLGTTCTTYTGDQGGKVLGQVTCNGAKSSTSSSSGSSSSGSSTATGTSSSSSSTSSSKSAAIMTSPSAASSFTVFGVMAAFFGLLM